MSSIADGEFRRCGDQESEMLSSRVVEFRRWGSSIDGEFRRWGSVDYGSSVGEFSIGQVKKWRV